MKKLLPLCTLLILFSIFNCAKIESGNEPTSNQYITVLGIVQDAGFPQLGCENTNCQQF